MKFCDRPQHHTIALWHPFRIPVRGIAYEFDAFARRLPVKLPRTRTRRLECKLVPIPSDSFPLRRARITNVGHRIHERPVQNLGVDLDREIVRGLHLCDRGEIVSGLRSLALVIVRRVRLHHLVEIPHHGVRVKSAAVVKLYALTNFKRPDFLGFGINRPALCQVGNDFCWTLILLKVPPHQRVIERKSNEANAFGTAGRLPANVGDV